MTATPMINVVVRYVADQDRSIAFWTGPMGWEVRTDSEMSPGTRWVEVAPPGRETGMAILAAAGFGVEARGGDAPFTLVVDDVRDFHARLTAAGTAVTEPAEEGYGTYVTMTCPDGFQHVVSQLREPEQAPA